MWCLRACMTSDYRASRPRLILISLRSRFLHCLEDVLPLRLALLVVLRRQCAQGIDRLSAKFNERRELPARPILPVDGELAEERVVQSVRRREAFCGQRVTTLRLLGYLAVGNILAHLSKHIGRGSRPTFLLIYSGRC